MNGPAPDRPHRDALFTILTRPTAPGGVPFPLIFAGCVVVIVPTILTMNPAWLVLLLPGWGFLKWKASKDMHIGEVLIGWVLGAGRSPHRKEWGGSTVAPLSEDPTDFGAWHDG